MGNRGRIFLVSPFHMPASRPMTRFARYVDFPPGGGISVGSKVIIFPEICGVATGTHGVPVLSVANPMKPIMGRYHLPGVLMKPFLFPLIPALACCLKPAARKFDQVLLQGKNTKRIHNRVVVIGTVIALGVDEERTISFKKPAGDAIGREGYPAEIAQHGAILRVRHGVEMVGKPPIFCLLSMTRLAAGRACVGCRQ